MHYVLARIADNQNVYEKAKQIDVIQATEWITSAWKEVSKDTIKSSFAECGVVEQPASIDDDKDVDEEFNNLFEELSKELQIDGDIALSKYFKFDHKVFTSFPLKTFDEFHWIRVSMATCIQEYGATDDTAIEVESDDGNDEDKKHERDVSQISSREDVGLLDRLVQVDSRTVDDTNAFLYT